MQFNVAIMGSAGHGKSSLLAKLCHYCSPAITFHKGFTDSADLVLLVVAADEGVTPQTNEAVLRAQSAKLPIIVAINKMDEPRSLPDRVRRQLSDQDLVCEEWAGDTVFCEVSADTEYGFERLLGALQEAKSKNT